MISNPNTMGNWPGLLCATQRNSFSDKIALQYNFWSGRTVLNIGYHGGYTGDGQVSYNSPFDYENYYKLVADGGTFTMYKGASINNITQQCFQYVFTDGSGAANSMITLFPFLDGRLDMNFYSLKVWDANGNLIHHYRPITDGVCDVVQNYYAFLATTTGHINGPAAT